MAEGKRRHWKQRWNPNAEFVYRRSLRLMVKGRPKTVKVGDKVDKELWGAARLRRLWESGAIELAGWEPPVPGRGDRVRRKGEPAPAEPKPVEEEVQVGGGSAGPSDRP